MVGNFIYSQLRTLCHIHGMSFSTAVIITSVTHEMSQPAQSPKTNVRICKNTSISILHVIFNISARSSKAITIFGVFMSYNKAATLYSTKKRQLTAVSDTIAITQIQQIGLGQTTVRQFWVVSNKKCCRKTFPMTRNINKITRRLYQISLMF